MKRMKVLFGNRRMMVMLTLAILVLAAAALIASSASFTATSTNVDNVFTSGDLLITNGTLAFPAVDLMPGDTVEGSVSFTTNADSIMYVKLNHITDDVMGPAPGNERLSSKLHLYIYNDLLPTPLIWDGLLSDTDLTTDGILLGNASSAGSDAYRFVMAFPDADVGVTALSGKGLDNGYQNLQSTVVFDWIAASR